MYKILLFRTVLEKMPREAVDTPSLEALKAGLDGALSRLSWWLRAQPMAGGWDWVGFKDTSYLSL